ncbi:MAG: 16S rRNA (cytosine(1402)-N(4))-methyltransferase RsmH [Candidatus Omnitrophica bacterium]|nr:16S rRNA (cytosine(1402)-N(4))-methyltransferase RsmH [Candidatus Omnitrophota bacterium]
MEIVHKPVLLHEVVSGLAVRPGGVVLDATIGLGGHAQALLESAGPDGRLIGIDRDKEALEAAEKRLQKYGGRMTLIHSDFGKISELLNRLKVGKVDAVLFDLGVSSLQLDRPQRGFSFKADGPLDMRMDPHSGFSAAELVNRISARDLEELLRLYGQERWAGRIARAIVKERPFATTGVLAETIRKAVPPTARRGRINPATRSFQAIRIAVNKELELLPSGLNQAIDHLREGGRIAVLSYHSLEHRIVRNVFRDRTRAGQLKMITARPVVPAEAEVARNSRARSANLRIAERSGTAP